MPSKAFSKISRSFSSDARSSVSARLRSVMSRMTQSRPPRCPRNRAGEAVAISSAAPPARAARTFRRSACSPGADLRIFLLQLLLGRAPDQSGSAAARHKREWRTRNRPCPTSLRRDTRHLFHGPVPGDDVTLTSITSVASGRKLMMSVSRRCDSWVAEYKRALSRATEASCANRLRSSTSSEPKARSDSRPYARPMTPTTCAPDLSGTPMMARRTPGGNVSDAARPGVVVDNGQRLACLPDLAGQALARFSPGADHLAQELLRRPCIPSRFAPVPADR